MDNEKVKEHLYRREQAEDALAVAEVCTDMGKYREAVGRLYYAVFHTIRSVLALDGVDFSKHQGVISYFRKEYIKTGIFSKAVSDTITMTFDKRNVSDYGKFLIVSKSEIDNLTERAVALMDEVNAYTQERVREMEADKEME